jgi:hypothetical protein
MNATPLFTTRSKRPSTTVGTPHRVYRETRDDMTIVIQDGDNLTQSIETEKVKKQYLMERVKKLTEHIEARKLAKEKALGAKDIAMKARMDGYVKREKKIEELRSKLNIHTSTQQSLQKEITSERYTCVQFNSVIAQLKKDIEKLEEYVNSKKTKGEQCSKSIAVMEQKVSSLRHQIDKEEVEFQSKYRELSKSLVEEEERLRREVQFKKLGLKGPKGKPMPQNGDMSKEEEKMAKSQMKKSAWAYMKQAAVLQKKKMAVTTLDEAFEEMIKFTGESDLNVVVDKFLEQEDTNNREFKRINDILLQCETVSGELEEVYTELDKFKNKDEEGNDQPFLGLSHTEAINKYRGMIDKNMVVFNRKSEILKGCAVFIEKIYNGIGCSTLPGAQEIQLKISAAKSMAGPTNGSITNIDFDTLVQMMGSIELKIVELLLAYTFQLDSSSDKRVETNTKAVKHQGGMANKANLDDVISDDEGNNIEEDLTPCRIEDMMRKVKDRYLMKGGGHMRKSTDASAVDK